MSKRIKAFFTIAALAAGLLCLFGCKTTNIPIERISTDTLYISKHQRDSIWLHDSIHVTEKQRGDTVYLQLERWHTKYIEKATHDTTYIATHDTVPNPYPVEVKVEKSLTWWQQTRLHIGGAVLWALLIYLFLWAIKKRIL